MEIQTKWFSDAAPLNAKKATASIGSGDNGVVAIAVNEIGTSGNSYTIAVAVGTGALGAVLTGNDLVITLQSTGNTASEIAEAVNTAVGDIFTATASGTGATKITTAVTKKSFSGGQFGTIAPIPYTMLLIGNVYYTNIAPNGKYDSNWRTVTFTTY